MVKAKYYIYRNLHKGGFSVRHRGLVIANIHRFTADDVEFRISEAGRRRAVRQQSRNVHAYLVSDNPPKELRWRDSTFDRHIDENEMEPVFYHPLKLKNFVVAGTKRKVTSSDHVVARDGKVYVSL